MEHDNPSTGLLTTLRQMADTVLKVLHNRIELFATELQEEKLRAIGLLVMIVAGILFGVLAILMATLTIVLFFPAHRLLVSTILTVLYIVVTALLFWRVRDRLTNGPAPFAGTVEELKKDRKWLQPKN